MKCPHVQQTSANVSLLFFVLQSQKLPVLSNATQKSCSRSNIFQQQENSSRSSSTAATSPCFPTLNNNNSTHTNNCNNNVENSPPAAELKIGFNGRRLPITPAEAIKYFGNRLTDYEKTEIEKYPEIWYVGLDACKIHGEDFDDDNGSYNKVSFYFLGFFYIYLLFFFEGSA